MKTAVIVFRSILDDFDGEYIQRILSSLGDVKVNTLEVLSDDDDVGFSLRYDSLRDSADNLLIFVPKSLKFDVKEVVSKKMDSPLCENDHALSIVNNLDTPPDYKGAENYTKIPLDAILIPNTLGAFQGFLIEEQQFTLAVLPAEVDQLESMCKGFIEPYFSSKYGESKITHIIKYIGEEGKAVKEISEIRGGACDFEFSVKEINRDCTITLCFEKGVDKTQQDKILKDICVRLNDGIYAREDMSLGQALLLLLQNGGKRIATAESFTSGRVVGEILKNSGASQVVHEGIVCYSNQSKEQRLSVDGRYFVTDGAVSSKVAYSMAVGLLKNLTVDIAISTTGIAGPKSDDTLKPVGLCYIGVGSRQGVDVYKYNLNGDRERITETAKNLALFLAIKKLKNY